MVDDTLNGTRHDARKSAKIAWTVQFLLTQSATRIFHVEKKDKLLYAIRKTLKIRLGICF